MKRELFAVLAVAVGLLVAGPTFAHHSGAIYDREHPITLQGTVTEFRFTNPHSQILFEVKEENGNMVEWIAFHDPPGRLYRAGWNTKTLKPGDQITVTGAPARDGRKIMNVRKVVGPKGQVLSEGAE